ncbi:unnamed protein product [Medioppia subpectinata]|uniref:Presenilin n=1 Tax=Medioppia subpectinata TaxID=1979941 RepID=A0A7R9KB95_9ACAR|nr:unnamed protein product [Medioppia subpectinata]CAG2100225.1 unnamed protein product [Medioppia subpectinata]
MSKTTVTSDSSISDRYELQPNNQITNEMEPKTVPDISAEQTVKKRDKNVKQKDEKPIDKKKLKRLQKLERERKRFVKLIHDESKRLMQIIIPITVTMFLVILSIQFFPVFSTGKLSRTFGEKLNWEKEGSSSGSKLGTALIAAAIFVVLMAIITFVMALIIIYNFMVCVKVFFIFAFVIYFGLFSAGYVYIALDEYNVPMDWITVGVFIWNYTAVGIVIFFIAGPKLLKQTYLILLSANVALILILVLPEWTTWLLLGLMSIWDLYAVLHKTGPLNKMLSALEDKKQMPPILYSTVIFLQTDVEEDDDSGVQLGLGDFVFYSLLVGRSYASSDLLTAIICYISITVGLAITLSILVTINTPLPALPISIALGVIFYFSSKYFIIPFNDELQERLIFI